MNDRTQCPACFEAYMASGGHVPRLLPCGHSLCEGCLENLLTIGRVRCPKNGKKFESTTGIRKFPQNESILQYLRKDSAETPGGTGQFQICRLHSREMSLYYRGVLCNHSESEGFDSGKSSVTEEQPGSLKESTNGRKTRNR